MSIGVHAGNPSGVTINSAETMYRAVKEAGIIPFFENPLPGWSVEEKTDPSFWFDGDSDTLGPWDCKIWCLQAGDIVYGKFLGTGKASFATPRWYRELRNWRRSLPKYLPDAAGRKILDYLSENGSITIKQVRQLLGVKKSAADAAIARLMMQCRVVTGDIERVYRGEDLHYNGWQVSTFCTPEDLFGDEDMHTALSPSESHEALLSHIMEYCGTQDRKTLEKLIG